MWWKEAAMSIQKRMEQKLEEALSPERLDVINESLHHPRYLTLLGPADVRDVYNQAVRSARGSG